MKQGDFSTLAKDYKNRAGYSDVVLDALVRYTGADRNGAIVADVGAGTGKFTEMLLARGLNCVAVEPNDAMREEGMAATSKFNARWLKGSGEATGLAPASMQWLTMASSFHWVDQAKGLAEFARVLKPGGYFTALWNPRNIQSSEFHMKIERMINEVVPDLKRVSSGGSQYTATLAQDLNRSKLFKNVLFMEAEHDVAMSPERYLGAWQSVNDIQAQAGIERWKTIMENIRAAVEGMDEIIVPYKTRAWTVQKV